MRLLPPSVSIFLSTPSARRATRRHQEDGEHHQISIHALREEGDLAKAAGCLLTHISIHALREEGDFPSHWGRPTP